MTDADLAGAGLTKAQRAEVKRMINAAIGEVLTDITGPAGPPGPPGPPGPAPTGPFSAILGPVQLSLTTTPTPGGAVSAHLTITGDNMANITVDTTTLKATLSFDDDKGDTDAPEPAGTVATFSVVGPSTNPSATPSTTGAVNASNPNEFDITPGTEGDAFAIACALNGTAISPVTGAAIADPANSQDYLVGPGGAVSASLSESQ